MASEGKNEHWADQACSAGALSHIGTLLLITHNPAGFAKVVRLTEEEGLNIVEAERKIFGTSHAELGAYLLGLWGFSDLIVEAVAFHHEPSRCNSQEITPLTAVHAAQFLTHGLLDDPAATESDTAAIDLGYFKKLGCIERLQEWQKLAAEFQSKSAAA